MISFFLFISSPLTEWQFFIDSLRDMHEPVRSYRWCPVCRCIPAIFPIASCCRPVHLLCAGMLFIRCLALAKFLFFYYHICGIYLLTVPVCVASCLDPSGGYDLDALPQIFLCKFCIFPECNAAYEVCCWTILCPESPVYCQCDSLKESIYELRRKGYVTIDEGDNKILCIAATPKLLELAKEVH